MAEKTIYVVTLKSKRCKEAYTSLAAISEAFDYEEIKLSKSYIKHNLPFSNDRYENSKVIIERMTLRNKTDVLNLRDKEQPAGREDL